MIVLTANFKVSNFQPYRPKPWSNPPSASLNTLWFIWHIAIKNIMAYGQYLAAVPTERLHNFRTTVARLRQTGAEKALKTTWLEVDKIVLTTHYFASAGTPDRVLTEIIGELFDGGVLLDEWYWHSLYPPKFHPPEKVRQLSGTLRARWMDLMEIVRVDEVPFWEADFAPIFEILDFAVQNQSALLTFLDKPLDEERAAKVFYPVDPAILNNMT